MKAFTLIELVIVVTILAILAAVAIPVFGILQKQAKDAATKGALAAMREAIQLYRMNEIARGAQPGTGSWPSNGCPSPGFVEPAEQLADVVKVMENGIVPDNPWAASTTYILAGHENWVSGISAAKSSILITSDFGWFYNYFGTFGTMCDIWANTAVNGGPITENNF